MFDIKSIHKYSLLLNREVLYDLGEKPYFAILDINDILKRLESDISKGYKIDTYNIGKFYHLNMLQSFDDTIKMSSQLFQEFSAINYSDIVIDGKTVVKSDVLSKTKPHLVDIWFVTVNGNVYVYKSLENMIEKMYLDDLFNKLSLTISNLSRQNIWLYIILAGNISRAIFFYKSYGYFKMIFDAGRLAQALHDMLGHHLIEDIDLNKIDDIFMFDSERYCTLALMCAESDGAHHE